MENHKKESSDSILRELLAKQLKDVPTQKKLQYTDLKRISRKISSSIFDYDQCVLWKGYITNANNKSKGVYINFYFRGKKVALHRLLYSNFIGPIDDDQYIKFACENRGMCCNLNHLKKYSYNRNDEDTEHIKKTMKQKSMNNIDVNFIIDFD